MPSRYEVLAARRYKWYTWQKRRESIDSNLFMLLIRFLRDLFKVLQVVRLTTRRKIESVDVE
ncbi:MAG: hypothetical protein ACREBU_25895 [Nitrososphaera sp.]